LAGFVWLILLTAIFVVPWFTLVPAVGDDLIRRTIWLALLFYGVATALMIALVREDWQAFTQRGRLTRWCWTLAWLAYLVHLAMAFHHYHHWSHAHALEHTRQVSGVGEGIYVSHLFTLVWTADVAYWWCRPDGYAARSRWMDAALHGFMLFVVANATVVYAEGTIRWAGVGLLVVLTGLWLQRRLVRHREP
jgi:hypothetical protein